MSPPEPHAAPEPVGFPTDLPALTSIRFLLAAGVAFFHYHLLWTVQDTAATQLIERARLGVDVFFILSGFILTHVYQRQFAEGRYHHGRFLLARIARIYPMHLAALALFLVMVLAGRSFAPGFDAAVYPWSDLGRALALVQAWSLDPRPNAWNGPSWSLSAEWFAYLVYPAFAWLGWKLQRRPWLLLTLAGALFAGLDLAYAAAYGRVLPRAEEALGVLRIIPTFLYGVALYRLGERVQLSRRGALLFATGAAAGVLALLHIGADDRLIVAAAGPLVLSLAMLARPRAEGVLSSRTFVLLGEASYALYLLHLPLLIGWRYGAALLTGRSSTTPLPLPEVLGLFAITVAAAIVAHLLWERPARRWIKRWSARTQRKPAPGVEVAPRGSPPG